MEKCLFTNSKSGEEKKCNLIRRIRIKKKEKLANSIKNAYRWKL